jgi:hypothetical protein
MSGHCVGVCVCVCVSLWRSTHAHVHRWVQHLRRLCVCVSVCLAPRPRLYTGKTDGA